MKTDVYTDLSVKAQKNDNFLWKIITRVEIWCYQYDSEIEQQSVQWKTQNPQDQKSKNAKIKVETMLICFYINDIVQKEFIPEGQTVKQADYMEILNH